LHLGQWLRFPSRLIKPDVRIRRIRLSDRVQVRLTTGVGGYRRASRAPSLLDQTLAEACEKFADLAPEALESLMEEAVAATRRAADA
jgi:hypothetical protein